MVSHGLPHRLRGLGLAAALAVGAGCSSSSKKAVTTTTAGQVTTATSAPAPTTPTTVTQLKRLTILVTNDDGYGAPGIDAVVEVLRKLPNVDVSVVAPATNQSGVGGASTPGTLTATKAATKSGYPAEAVAGHPADAVRYAIDTLHLSPDVVVSGVNLGQNLGPALDISGTVGAARAAAARGIPAVAASQGIGNPVQYEVTAKVVAQWITVNRLTLRRDPGAKAGVITNINGPSCAKGTTNRGTITLPPAPANTPGALSLQDCTSTRKPTNDVEGLNEGYVVVDTIPLYPASRTGG